MLYGYEVLQKGEESLKMLANDVFVTPICLHHVIRS